MIKRTTIEIDQDLLERAKAALVDRDFDRIAEIRPLVSRRLA